MSALLTSFLSNLSTVLNEKEISLLKPSLESFSAYIKRPELYWAYLNEEWQKEIINRLGLPSWYPYYPLDSRLTINLRELFSQVDEDYQLTIIKSWFNLNLDYEETVMAAREGCFIIEDDEEWDLLLLFRKEYIINFLKGEVISFEDWLELKKDYLSLPKRLRPIPTTENLLEFHTQVKVIIKKSTMIVDYNIKIESFVGNPNDSIYLGVELETLYSTQLEVEDLFNYNKEGEIALLKTDSSIEGQGFEIVTAAMSLDFQLEYWRKLIEQFGCELIPHSSCGMHVHISREPLSQLQIGKILVFLNEPANDWFISKIAGRPANDYCERSQKTIEDVNCPTSRYEALNLTNDSTIEFRIFSSTNKYEEIASRIEFCHALTKYCEHAELTKLKWKHFKQWVIQEDNPLYSHLKEWLINN